MRIICMDGFDKEERETYRSVCQSNIVDGMSALVRMSETFGYQIHQNLQVSFAQSSLLFPIHAPSPLLIFHCLTTSLAHSNKV